MQLKVNYCYMMQPETFALRDIEQVRKSGAYAELKRQVEGDLRYIDDVKYEVKK